MSTSPILVLQMQRMGDLIMTFPLLGWLQQAYPEHPVWVVAEERFFLPLQRLSPSVVFFPPEAFPKMQWTRFHSIINVSHRSDAAQMCGKLQADQKFGAYEHDKATYINGFWALYRASIVHNNRYNRFHWSDMYLLDHTGISPLPTQPMPQKFAPTSRKIAIVVGASEQVKHPSPQFWGDLAKALLQRDLHPFFIGGKEDKALGAAASSIAGLPHSNLCGRFTLAELAEILPTMRCCISPDTGPMHLAAWLGVPVINVSMGTVNPWETGPFSPGNTIVQAKTSCTGCWQCTRNAVRCHDAFTPEYIASLTHTLIHKPQSIAKRQCKGVQVSYTKRDKYGRYQLQPYDIASLQSSRALLSAFWQQWFLSFHHDNTQQLNEAVCNIAHMQPRLFQHMQRAVPHLGQTILHHFKKQTVVNADFWHQEAPFLRPFTGYMHLCLQNKEFRADVWQEALRDFSRLAELFDAHNQPH